MFMFMFMISSFEHDIILFSVFQTFWRLNAVTEAFMPFQESALRLWSHPTFDKIKNHFQFNTFQGYTDLSYWRGQTSNLKLNITRDGLTTITPSQCVKCNWLHEKVTWLNRLTEPWLNLNSTPLKCSDSTVLMVPSELVFSLKFAPGRSLCLKKTHTHADSQGEKLVMWTGPPIQCFLFSVQTLEVGERMSG